LLALAFALVGVSPIFEGDQANIPVGKSVSIPWRANTRKRRIPANISTNLCALLFSERDGEISWPS